MTFPSVLTFVHPATGEKYGEVQYSTPEEIRQAMNDLQISSRIWGKSTLQERIRVLKEFQGYLVDHADEIADTVSYATGKSPQDGLAEVFMTVDLINHYCSKAPGWLRPRLIRPGISVLFKLPILQHRPRGVVVVIGPWNYPFNLNMTPIITALLAGNTVAVKPSEITGAVGKLLDDLLSGFAPLAPYVRVLHGDGRVGAALVESKPDYIYLTGSIGTAKKIMADAAKNLIPCGFELGGKDPAIILEDADLHAAAHWTVWGAVYNAGQSCMAIERVYVVESVYNQFLQLLLEEISAIKVGYSRSAKSPYHYGPFTCDLQLKIVKAQMEDARARGAEVLTGGEHTGLFYEPTLLTKVNHEMAIMQDENFGPVVPVMKVSDEWEAIRLANDSSFGLGASVWSGDLGRAYRISRQLHASSVIVNDSVVQFTVSTTPYGGIKQSGNVSSHGEGGLLEFMVPQVILVGPNPLPFDIATILRSPGRYKLQKILINVLFGRSLQQRTAPLREALHDASTKSALSQLAGGNPSHASTFSKLAAGALTLAAFTFAISRANKHKK